MVKAIIMTDIIAYYSEMSMAEVFLSKLQFFNCLTCNGNITKKWDSQRILWNFS